MSKPVKSETKTKSAKAAPATTEKPKVEKTEKPKAEKAEKTVAPKVEKTEKPKVEKAKTEKPKADKAVAPKTEKSEKSEAPKSKKSSKKTAVVAQPVVQYPEAPLAKRSAYAFFTQDKRNALGKENPDAKFGDLTRIVAKEWNTMTAAAKKTYEAMADKDVKRYETEKAKWDEEVKKLGGVPDDVMRSAREMKKLRKKKNKKVVKPPKNARNAYVFFTIEKREQLKGESLSFKEMANRLSDEWKKVSEADKARFEKLSKEDHVRYTEAMDKFYAENPDVDVKKRRTKTEGLPTRARNGYIFYCDELRSKVKAENPALVPKELMTELGKQWSKLSEAEKSKYVELAKKDKLRYDAEKSAWDAKQKMTAAK